MATSKGGTTAAKATSKGKQKPKDKAIEKEKAALAKKAREHKQKEAEGQSLFLLGLKLINVPSKEEEEKRDPESGRECRARVSGDAGKVKA